MPSATKQQVQWTPQLDKDLVELVMAAESVEAGLKVAAEMFGTTFYAVRNRWYSDVIKVIRPLTEREQAREAKKAELEQLMQRAEQSIEQEPVELAGAETGIIAETEHIELLQPAIEYIDAFGVSDNILTATKDFVNKVNQEVSFLRNKIVEIQSSNADWASRYAGLQRKYATLEEDYGVLSRVLNRARDLMNEEEIGPKPTPKRFIQDVNGNLEIAATIEA